MHLREQVETGHETRCPYCHGDLAAGETWRCPGCETPHHADCARENGQCTVLGCARFVPGTLDARALGRRYGESRFLRSVVLAIGIAAVMIFAAKFNTLRGDSLVDPFVISAFFVGITVWGTVYDRSSRRRAPDRDAA